MAEGTDHTPVVPVCVWVLIEYVHTWAGKRVWMCLGVGWFIPMCVFLSLWSVTIPFDLGTVIPLRLGANTGLGLSRTDNTLIKVPSERRRRERKYVKEISVLAQSPFYLHSARWRLSLFILGFSEVGCWRLCRKFCNQSLHGCSQTAQGWNKEGVTSDEVLL